MREVKMLKRQPEVGSDARRAVAVPARVYVSSGRMVVRRRTRVLLAVPFKVMVVAVLRPQPLMLARRICQRPA